MFDCPDGSDEDEQFCDLSQTKGFFVCCTENKKVTVDKVCDIFDDCPRDKSDQFLEACLEKTGGELNCLEYHHVLQGFWSFSVELVPKTISRGQLNDGVPDCINGMDETCGWKQNLPNWVDPFKTPEFYEYLNFLEMLETNPAGSRWYTMVSREELEKLGHNYEVILFQNVLYILESLLN